MPKAEGLSYEVHGEGEPVLLIHGSHIADAFLPLTREAVLAERYRFIRYHRRGLGDSDPHVGPFSIEQQAQDALTVIQQLGVERVHVVGHSYGAVTAVQLALDAPTTVSSLVLLEPPLMTAAEAEAASETFAPLMETYHSGDPHGAVEEFMTFVGGSDWRAEVAAVVPGGPEQAERDAATFFEVELPALAAWIFDEDKARRITQPALFVLGTESGPLFEGPKELFGSLVPHAEEAVLPGLNHLLQMRDAGLVAAPIADFLARHPLSTEKSRG